MGVEGPPALPLAFSRWVLPTPTLPALRSFTNFLFSCLAELGKVLKNKKCPRQENTLKAETRLLRPTPQWEVVSKPGVHPWPPSQTPAHGGTLSPGQERRELGSPGMSGDHFKVTAVLMSRRVGQILWEGLGGQVTGREEPGNRDLLFSVGLAKGPCPSILTWGEPITRGVSGGSSLLWPSLDEPTWLPLRDPIWPQAIPFLSRPCPSSSGPLPPTYPRKTVLSPC